MVVTLMMVMSISIDDYGFFVYGNEIGFCTDIDL